MLQPRVGARVRPATWRARACVCARPSSQGRPGTATAGLPRRGVSLLVLTQALRCQPRVVQSVACISGFGMVAGFFPSPWYVHRTMACIACSGGGGGAATWPHPSLWGQRDRVCRPHAASPRVATFRRVASRPTYRSMGRPAEAAVAGPWLEGAVIPDSPGFYRAINSTCPGSTAGRLQSAAAHLLCPLSHAPWRSGAHRCPRQQCPG